MKNYSKSIERINFLIALIIVICTTIIAGCGRSSRGNGNRNEPPVNNNVQIYINNVSSYNAGSYNFDGGVNVQQTIYQNNPVLLQRERETGLGGAKLIGEMSADAIGIYVSCPSEPVAIPIGTPSELHLAPPKDPNNIVIGLLNHNISVYLNPIEPCNLVDALMGIFSGDATAPMRVTVDVTNITNITQVIVIEQGQMLEAEKEDVQNIVVCKSSVTSLSPGESAAITLECMCAAHHRGSPVGSRVKLTPYILDAPSSVFEKQQRVWDFLERITIDASPHSTNSFYDNSTAQNIGYHRQESNSTNKVNRARGRRSRRR